MPLIPGSSFRTFGGKEFSQFRAICNLEKFIIYPISTAWNALDFPVNFNLLGNWDTIERDIIT